MRVDWPAENIVLALLCERPMHGYELAQLLKSDAVRRAIWRIETSEVYFLLRKLLKLGLVEEQAEERAAGPQPCDLCADAIRTRVALEGWLVTPERIRVTFAPRCWPASTWPCAAIHRWRCR